MSVVASSTGDAYMVKTLTGLVIGKTYNVSVWAYITATGTQFTVGRSLFAFDGSSAQVSAAINQSLLNQWQRLSLTIIPTTTSLQLRLYPYLNNTSTIYYDDVQVTEGTVLHATFCGADTDCSWSGTADASTSSNTVNLATTLDYSYDVDLLHGQELVVRSGGGRLTQIVEQSKVPSGTYTIAHSGTATMRVYKNTLAPASRPAFQASPFSFTADGTDDIVVEFTNPGGGSSTGTISQVRMYAGSTDFGFALQNVDDELRACQRYYHRWYSYAAIPGTQASTTGSVFPMVPSPPLRAFPWLSYSGAWVTDLVSYNTGVTGLIMGIQNYDGNGMVITATHGANGAQYRPVFLGGQAPQGPTNYFDLDAELR